MRRTRISSLLRAAALLAPLALALGACETLQDLNPLDRDDKKPLTGDRRALFPNGVPGVQYSAPPTQPTNSNVALDNMPPPQNQTPDAAPQQEPEQPPTRQARTKRAAPNNPPPASTEDDPWAGQRR